MLTRIEKPENCVINCILFYSMGIELSTFWITELFLEKILTKFFKNSVQEQLSNPACVLRIVFKITSLSVISKLIKIT